MKKEKGEAAFESADEVLTDRIIDTTEKHGSGKVTSDEDSSPDCSFDAECQEQEKSKSRRNRAIIIAVCTGIAILVVGIVLFGFRKCRCGK